MKKILALLSIIIMIFSSALVLADDNSKKKDVEKPKEKSNFDKIWDAILQLQIQIKNIQLIPGPQGPKGDIGLTGDVGPKGDIGLTGDVGPQGDQGIQGLQGDIGVCSCDVSLSAIQSLENRIALLEGQVAELTRTCTPSTEICDNIDNDCDGSIDEGFYTGQQCLVGVGACIRTGFRVCTPNGQSTQCNAVSGIPTIEVCNNFDDDCDGAIDEGVDICGGGNQQCIHGECKAV